MGFQLVEHMNRLEKSVQDSLATGRKQLVAYIVAGDPAPDWTIVAMHALVEAGVDVIELGVPFTDPEAEGPVIQGGHERALTHGVTLKKTLAMVQNFRERDDQTPVLLMGYLNPIEAMGLPEFAVAAKDVGVDGTIIVNLPPEESGELGPVFEQHGIVRYFFWLQRLPIIVPKQCVTRREGSFTTCRLKAQRVRASWIRLRSEIKLLILRL